MIELFVIIYGIVILVRGRVGVGKGRELQGGRARIVGGILLSHLLIAFAAGMVMAMVSMASGKGGEVGFGASLAVSLASLIIVITTAHIVGQSLYRKQEAEKLITSTEQVADPNA